MLEKIQNNPKLAWLLELRDVRMVGFVVFGIITLLVSWSTVSVIQTNYELQRQMARLEQENKVAELENRNLKLRNEYYKTDQYLELSARKQFNKAAPGEKLYIVPKSVALSHTVEMPGAAEAAATEAAGKKPTYQQNLDAWKRFFLNGGSAVD